MKRRREHGECDTNPGGRGCLVFGTPVCTLRKDERLVSKSVRWVREHVVVLRWRIEFRYGPLVWWKVAGIVLGVLVAGVGVLLGLVLGRM